MLCTLYTSLVHFHMYAAVGGLGNFETIFNLCRYFSSDGQNRILNLSSVRLCQGQNLLHNPKREKFIGVISGERGGQAVGPPQPIQSVGKVCHRTSFVCRKRMRWCSILLKNYPWMEQFWHSI